MFQCLLGDKYGSTEAPLRIPKDEFETIRAAIFEKGAGKQALCHKRRHCELSAHAWKNAAKKF